MRHFLPLLAEKFVKTPKHSGFLEKVAPFCKIDDLYPFFAKYGTLCNFCLKSSSKRWNTVVSSKNLQVLRNLRFFPFFRKMRHSLQLLARNFVKTAKHGGFFQKCLFLAKRTSCPVFSRNEALFATLGGKVCQNPETRCFLRKVARFGQIDYFSCFFTKWGSFCHYCLKSSAKRWNTVVSSKTWTFLPNRRFSVFFHEMRNFLPLLAEMFGKTPKHGGFFEKCPALAKSTIFRVFPQNLRHFANISWKGRQNNETLWLLRKVWSFGQIDDFSCFFLKWGTFCDFCVKSSSKRRNTMVSSINLQLLPKWTISLLFPRNEALFATFGWKVRQNAETRWFLRKSFKFCEIDDFSRFFAKWGTLCNFWPKSSSKRPNTVVSSKTWKFWPNRRFSVFFHEMRNFLPLFAEKFGKTPKHDGFFEKCPVLAKSTIFCVFPRNLQLFANIGWKGRQNAETLWLLRKVGSFGQIDNFSCFLTKWGFFCNFWLKRSSKRGNTVVSSKSL